jgi:hypothetical protein
VSSFAEDPDLVNVLGFAAPITVERSLDGRVRQAIMFFDLDAFARMEESSRVEVMIHELG